MSSKSVLALPPYTFRLRLAQFVISALVLIIDIIATAIFGGYGALGYGIFTPIATLVIVGYWWWGTYRNHVYYNRWAILILDCFSIVWWLSLWSVLALWAGTLGAIETIDNEVGYTDLGAVHTVHALTAIAATLGAIEFVLFIVSLVTFSISLHRTRIAERNNGQQNPFTNINYETSNPNNNYDSNRPKGGMEVA